MVTKFNFDKRREQSAIKSEIAVKYFKAWCNVMSRRVKIGYIDLFSGQGIYSDGEKSTPILILEYVIQDEKLSNKVVTIFNDKEKKHVQDLETNIKNLKNIYNLRN